MASRYYRTDNERQEAGLWLGRYLKFLELWGERQERAFRAYSNIHRTSPRTPQQENDN